MGLNESSLLGGGIACAAFWSSVPHCLMPDSHTLAEDMSRYKFWQIEMKLGFTSTPEGLTLTVSRNFVLERK